MRIYNLLENIDRSKYHFDFAVCGSEQAGEKKAVDYGAQIFHLPYIEGRSGKKEYLKQLSALLKNTRYDVVHSHLAFMNISTLKLAKQYGIPIER